MSTVYVPKRQRRPRRGVRLVATVLIGAAAYAGIGAALSAGEHHPRPAAVVTVAHKQLHHEHYHQAHAVSAGKSPKLKLRLHLRLPYRLRPHPFRRLFWRPRFSLFRRSR